MSEETTPPLVPEEADPIELDEQAEAAIVNHVESFKNHDVRTSIFKAMVDFKNAMVAKGLTHGEVCKFIGNIAFDVHPSIYGSEIYLKTLEVAVDNTFRLRQAFIEDFNEEVFVAMSRHLSFRVRLPQIFDPNQT